MGEHVTVGGVAAPTSLNPYLDDSEIAQALAPLLFDSLLVVNPRDGQLLPHLARSFEVSEDGLTFTFQLQENARWHDGQRLTAQDVLFTWRAMLGATDYHRNWIPPQRISGLAVPNETTIVVTLAEPYCSLLYDLGQAPILPRHLLEGDGLFDADYGQAPVGSGPFTFANWSAQGGVLLRGNKTYWQGAPSLETWTYRPFTDTVALQQGLTAGSVDAAIFPPADNAKVNGFSTYVYPRPEMFFIAFNQEHPISQDIKVRQALGHALDRAQILAEALEGRGVLLGDSLDPQHWANDETVTWPGYDLNLARTLLSEAGLVDEDGDGWVEQAGETVEIALRTNADNELRRSIAILASQYWRAVGVKTNVELVSWPSLVDNVFTHDFETVVLSWPLMPDPDQSRFWRSTENRPGFGLNIVSFADEQVDAWLTAGLTAPGCAPASRAPIYAQIQSRLAEARPYDFLLLPQATLLTIPKLRGPAPGLWGGPFWNANEWFLAR